LSGKARRRQGEGAGAEEEGGVRTADEGGDGERVLGRVLGRGMEGRWREGRRQGIGSDGEDGWSERRRVGALSSMVGRPGSLNYYA
jgi:hypothetical protein